MFKNIAYLALVQVSNFVFPVITLPYLVRTLGVSDYGSIMLSLAIVQYFSLVVDYGFNYSATREIAIAKSKKGN
ncbi:oligosaccharide flippase family protein [Erwinia aphidicola]|nr:oligosaccharide flippase family protein [Erwinia aphidicola]